jgi:hypothetical protein
LDGHPDAVWVIPFGVSQGELFEAFSSAGKVFFEASLSVKAPPVKTPPMIDKRFKTSRLIVKPMEGESEKVVDVLRSYLNISRQKAREIVRQKERVKVDALQVRELNSMLRAKKLRTLAHVGSCASLKK